MWGRLQYVALLAEGVDRNTPPMIPLIKPMTSPSSQRAWIEIRSLRLRLPVTASPSSQRAWIEIMATITNGKSSNGSPSSQRAWIEIA